MKGKFSFADYQIGQIKLIYNTYEAMILEAAFLYIKQDLLTQFEVDFAKASQYISSADGYEGHTLQKCLEVENKYLLLVNWNTLEDHTEGFRSSEAYLEWKQILHNYYEPFPIVEHFETVFENKI